jgi:predicted metal-dependent phosphotriesterase family hydrolase
MDARGICQVDITSGALNPSPPSLNRIWTEVELHMIAGCGFYVHAFRPAWTVSKLIVTSFRRLLIGDTQHLARRRRGTD